MNIHHPQDSTDETKQNTYKFSRRHTCSVDEGLDRIERGELDGYIADVNYLEYRNLKDYGCRLKVGVMCVEVTNKKEEKRGELN